MEISRGQRPQPIVKKQTPSRSDGENIYSSSYFLALISLEVTASAMQRMPRFAKAVPWFFSTCIRLFFMLGFSGSAFAQALTFTTNTFPTFTTAPYGVVAADVNGDGKVDLISASSNTLKIFTNGGNAVFGSNATLTGGDFVVAADVNGDGYVDLITPGGSTIQIFTNNGNGMFSLSAEPAVGGIIEYFAMGDMNGDGNLDLLSGNFSPKDNSVTILTNSGGGNFGSNATLHIPNPLCIATADINGDGSVDLITASTSFNSVTIYTNDGFGVLGSNATLHAGANPNWLICQDLNGDHKPDIVTANYGDNTLSIFTNNGSGIFSSNATVKLGSVFDGNGVSCVVAADLNGDGKPDLAAVNYTRNNMYILTNNGFGVFGSNVTINVPGLLTWVTAADLNGDGKLDLITANGQANSLSVFLNTSPFPPPNTTPALNVKNSGAKAIVSWPSDSAGWSLQQNPDLTTSNWGPSGYDGYAIVDDGTNKNLVVTPPKGNLFFRLLHP